MPKISLQRSAFLLLPKQKSRFPIVMPTLSLKNNLPNYFPSSFIKVEFNPLPSHRTIRQMPIRPEYLIQYFFYLFPKFITIQPSGYDFTVLTNQDNTRNEFNRIDPSDPVFPGTPDLQPIHALFLDGIFPAFHILIR